MKLTAVAKRLPPLYADVEHYFCSVELQVKQWTDRVNRNRKTEAVNRKLAAWHQENPDRAVVNLAEWRLERIRRKARGTL